MIFVNFAPGEDVTVVIMVMQRVQVGLKQWGGGGGLEGSYEVSCGVVLQLCCVKQLSLMIVATI